MNVNKMQTIRLLVISDMHVCKEEDSMTTSWLNTSLMELPEVDNPIESLKNYLHEKSIQIDYLLNLGDVTNKSYREGWVTGIKMLRDIQYSNNIRTMLHVLGNHDLMLETKNYQEFFLPKHTKDYPVADERLISEYWAKGYCLYEDGNALFLLCNSELGYKSIVDLKNPPVFLDDYNTTLAKDLDGFEGKNLIKIALIHHHVVPHTDYFNNQNKEDVIVGGDNFLKVLKDHGFNMVIHGHKHQSRYKKDDSISILASGSISSRQNVMEWRGNNYIHIVTLETDGAEVNGYIDSCKYIYRKGWIDSSDANDTIALHNGLGISRNVEDFAKEVLSHYKKELDAYKRIKVSELISVFHDYLYLSPLELENFKQFFSDNGYEFMSSKNQGEIISKVIE